MLFLEPNFGHLYNWQTPPAGRVFLLIDIEFPLESKVLNYHRDN